MWIVSQNRKRIVNTDKISEIFIGQVGLQIYANCYGPGEYATLLGEYENRETAKNVFNVLIEWLDCDLGIASPYVFHMPDGKDIDEWVNSVKAILIYRRAKHNVDKNTK